VYLGGMPPLDVTRTYLEMRSPADLIDTASPHPEARIQRVEFCPAAFFRYLYAEVGRAYRWTDRLSWSDAQVRAYLDCGDISLHVLYLEAAPAGYFELRRHPDRSIEVAYFGLMGDYIGRGLGGWLLTQATRAAWEEKPERVWLHTCTLDHPHALPNYLRRGFQVVRKEVYQIESVS
jgi:GNAT superfamily N-acetyltransferase